MVLDCSVNILLPDPHSFPNLEGVVTTFYDVEMGRELGPGDDWAQLVGGSEGVARTLNEQHRRLDVR